MKKGFTLVELLVVIAILAILATVSVVGYTSFITRANNSAAQQELVQIRDYAISVDLVKAEGGDMDGEVDHAEAEAAFENAGVESTVSTTEPYYTVDGNVYTYHKGNGSATWDITTGTIQ